MNFTISELDNGKSVLSYLKNTVKMSGGNISYLKTLTDGIEVNGEHVTVRYVLNTGDVLSIHENDERDNVNENIIPCMMDLDIIFENENIIAVNKPPYMPTHPSHNHTNDSLANGLMYLFSKRETPFVFRAAGRLDRNTSGVVLVAKNRLTASLLYKYTSNFCVRKRYIALLLGEIACDNKMHRIDCPIKRQSDSIIVRVTCDKYDEGGQNAVTNYKVLYSSNGISLVDIYPETGRTHQLRVHFAHIGFPILGDSLYGYESEYISRHALHAVSIKIPKLFSNEPEEFYAEPAEDIKSAFYRITGKTLNEFL